jgi:hypothetical protein
MLHFCDINQHAKLSLSQHERFLEVHELLLYFAEKLGLSGVFDLRLSHVAGNSGHFLFA